MQWKVPIAHLKLHNFTYDDDEELRQGTDWHVIMLAKESLTSLESSVVCTVGGSIPQQRLRAQRATYGPQSLLISLCVGKSLGWQNDHSCQFTCLSNSATNTASIILIRTWNFKQKKKSLKINRFGLKKDGKCFLWRTIVNKRLTSVIAFLVNIVPAGGLTHHIVLKKSLTLESISSWKPQQRESNGTCWHGSEQAKGHS